MTARQALIVAAALVAIAVGLSFGGSVPTASAQTISVTSANPPSGEQGTLSLDVTIGGKGFKNGANAKFYKTGTTDPAGVGVTSTRYVSSSQLVATINIADTAELSNFDIVVAFADGRTGKGTELFKVVAKSTGNDSPPPAIPVSVWLDNSEGNTIRAESAPESPYTTASVSASLRPGTANTYDYHFTFYLRLGTADLAAKRSVSFDFGQGRFAPGDKVPCYPTVDYPKDQAKVPYWYTLPVFLTGTGITEGGEKPYFLEIQTTYEWYKADDGAWHSTGQMFDPRPYVTNQPQPPDAQPHYVEFLVEFMTPELNDQDASAYLAYNGPIIPARGLAEITPSAGGGFVLKPVSAAGLEGSSLPRVSLYAPLRLAYDILSAENQANLTIKVPLGGRIGFKAWSGICNVGTFHMPFVMTVK